MRTFEFFFGSMLGELVLIHIDNLSKTLQLTSMSAAEGLFAVMNGLTNFGR